MATVSSEVSANDVVHGRARRVLWLSAALVVAFIVSLVVRAAGADYAPVDDWGVDVFELAMGGLCIWRYADRSWRSTASVAKAFPLVLGVACLAWGLGDVALTIESLGGANAPVPSVADGFYVAFFPLCFVSFVMVIRRGNSGSLVATSLDGVIAGLGAASISAAYVFSAVLKASGGTPLAAATNLTYPVGDLLLLAVAVGGLTILPKEYRRFLLIASAAMLANATGDLFNLLQPDSKLGSVMNGAAWPVSLFLLAVATWAQPATAWVRSDTAGTVDTDRSAGFAVPAFGAAASMAVLLTATFGHVGKTGVGLATATLLVAGVRLALTVREARALNSARFRSLIDNAWDLIVVAEATLDIAYVTPSVTRVLGYPPLQLQGRPITDLVHPDDTDTLDSHLRQLATATDEARGPAERAATAAFEVRMRHRDGAWRTIAWTATNLLGDPSVRGYVLNGGDVTEARQAVEDLAAARDGALQASKAKSDFLSTMSHEIRTPMNGVIGLTELLLDTPLDPDQHELAAGVKVSAENLLVIINDILDFSKIEAGKLDLEETDLNVGLVADDVGRILAGAAHSKGLELLVDVHPDVPTGLIGDRVRIQQVLLNLASNAVKFTLDGEVVVRVSVLHENAERVALRFDVIDMGIGIAEEDQKRLFRAFAQADSSTTRKFGGTGLGLAICRQLVELMGGTLGLVSAPGQGSTFWFELSLRRADHEPIVETISDPHTLTGLRALVVDDNATNRKILRQQLTSWGVEAAEAVDAYQAIGLTATGHRFDLAVIDLNMPGMDGIELAQQLKANPATAAMTLFLLSSSGERLTAAESHLRGFAASMTKPVRSSELFDCLITNLNGQPLPASAPDHAAASKEIEGMDVLGKILLVEDNPMNQLVGSKVLAKLGYHFDIANHGGEAVTAIQATRYDAVLMDCQMPEMDGYEATAEIRRIEGTTRHTPIIAMTAAAMDGDREVCLAAGMDDYITKPVRQDAIAAVLHRWLTPPAPAGTPAQDPDREPDSGLIDALDPSQIELLRSLDDGEGAVLTEIIDQYLTQTAHGRGELARVLGEGDTRGLERAAHTLRGSSANVGATALAAVCAEVEARARAEQLDDTGELMERFDAEFARARDALTELTTTSV
jgi:two-component system sensor histidine kinase/response regulator